MSDCDCEEPEECPPAGAPPWMATMADMMSLLLTFFVLLLSFANTDVVKFRMMLGSVKDAFGVRTEHPGDIEAKATTVIELSSRESTPLIDALEQQTQPGSSQSQSRIDRQLVDQLQGAISGLGIDNMVEVSTDRRGVVVRVRGQMLFESGAIELRPEALVFLDEIARLMEVFPYQVGIEGHTDDDPINSPLIPSNWHLSALRAIATLRYIEETSDVENHRLSAGGYGSTRPLAPNATPEGKAENRRVEFVFER